MKKTTSIISVIALALTFAVVGCGGGSKLNKSTKTSKGGSKSDGSQDTGGSRDGNIDPTGGDGDGSRIQLSDVDGAWIATRYNMVDSASGKTYESISEGWKVGALIADDGKVLFGVVSPSNKDHADYAAATLSATGPDQLSLNGHPFSVQVSGSTMKWRHVYFNDTVTVDIDWRPFDQKSDAWPKN